MFLFLTLLRLGLECGREFPGRETGGTGWAGRTSNFWYPGTSRGRDQDQPGTRRDAKIPVRY